MKTKSKLKTDSKIKPKGLKIDIGLPKKANGVHVKNGHSKARVTKNGASKNGHSKHAHSKNGHSKPEVYVLKSEQEPVLTEAELYKLLVKVRNGDFSVRLPAGQTGMKNSICQVMNEII